MFSLYLLLIVIMVFHHHKMILPWRVWVGGIPINLIEFGIVLVILNSLILSTGTRDPLDRQKRNFIWLILGLYTISSIGNTLIGVVRGAPMYNIFQTLKIALKLPAGILCGYLAIKNIKQARRVIKFISLLCCLMAVLILAHIRSRGAEYVIVGQVNILRTIAYPAGLAGAMAIFIIYSSAVNRGFFTHTSSIIILAMSVLACFGTLSKSDWVPLFLSILAVVWLTPKGLRIYSWRAVLTSGVWVTVVLMVGFFSAWIFLRVDMIGIVRDRFASLLQPLGDPTGPYIARWVAMKYELSLWLRSTIIFGAGFGSVHLFMLETGAEAGFAHNSFTNMLAQAGLVGLAALMSTLIVAYHLGRKMVHSVSPDHRAVGILAITSAFFLGIQSFLTMALNSGRAALFFGIVLGMTIKCYRFLPEPYWYEYFTYDQLEEESLIPAAYCEEEIYG